jgi:hypothetical protein
VFIYIDRYHNNIQKHSNGTADKHVMEIVPLTYEICLIEKCSSLCILCSLCASIFEGIAGGSTTDYYIYR